MECTDIEVRVEFLDHLLFVFLLKWNLPLIAMTLANFPI